MSRGRALPALVAATLVVGASAGAQAPCRPAVVRVATRAERSCYTVTSSHADVLAFLDSLQASGIAVHVGEVGRTSEGRVIPYVIASRPLVRTPAEARRLGRPVVYVQANIHAGEVEGKEALLALVRDLASAPGRNVLDSIVLVAVPLYNADGNEKLASQRVNRTAQNGPELVGQRPNGQGLDLNRDYVKAEAPETRASLAMFAQWDPDVFVDLHTTDGSYHGYQLTYSPSLHPAAALRGATFGGAYAADSLLPAVRRRMKRTAGLETFDYGNFETDEQPVRGRDPRLALLDSNKRAWITYDHRPRFGTNYFALRGRIAVLSEAYSHDPFETRVRATYAFVRELLHEAAGRAPRILALARGSDMLLSSSGGRAKPGVPVRATLTTHRPVRPVLVEALESTGDSSRTQPGVPAGIRRTGRIRAVRMPVAARFDPTLVRTLPVGWLLGPQDTAAVRLLRLHGVVVERLASPARAVALDVFTVDSVSRAEQPFQGHREVRVSGAWSRATGDLPEGTYVVPADQPLGVLAMILLEPESDDGLATWNVFDASVLRGGVHPVRRLAGALSAPRRAVP